jgi:glycosyltransferase involved in cell wall biosynthesis
MCLTRNRRQWLPQAIKCYQQQTYPHRELLILADGEDVRDLIPSDPTIRLVHLDRRTEIGEKRNFGCAIGSGDVLCHWDDDDWSAPGRMAAQVSRLLQSGLSVTGYSAMRFTDGARWWQYSGSLVYALGTSLCYWFDWWEAHPFPSLNVGEDNRFVEQAAQAGQLITADAKELMYATIHHSNTSPRQMSGSVWRRIVESVAS